MYVYAGVGAGMRQDKTRQDKTVWLRVSLVWKIRVLAEKLTAGKQCVWWPSTAW